MYRHKIVYTKLLPSSVEAESPNSAGGDQYNKLIYTIEGGNEAERFAIDYDTGAVTVGSAALDYESKPHHQLTVRATEGASGGGAASELALLSVRNHHSLDPRRGKRISRSGGRVRGR